MTRDGTYESVHPALRRKAMRLLGNLLIAATLIGLLGLGLIAADLTPPWTIERPLPTAPIAGGPAAVGALARPAALTATAATAAAPARPFVDPATDASAAPSGVPATPSSTRAAPSSAPDARPDAPTDASDRIGQPPAAPTPEPRLPIERVVVEAIGLDAPVVPARLVERGGAPTWEIPAFKAGHADGTAGAGARGNAVLLGHVDSLRSGDVFRQLERIAVGDAVTVWSGEHAYTYEVVEARAVARTDTAAVGTTEPATLTLLTCAGAWSPVLWDYTERFVVRAELRRSTD